MKKTFFLAGSLFVLVACNQSEQQRTGTDVSDTASHMAHDSANGTAHMAAQSMMDLMDRNMDQMEEMPSLGSNDKDFAALMKIHHAGALEMARLQVARGTDPQVKEMAQKMMGEQQREISEFDAFLSGNTQNSTGTGKNSAFYDRVMKEMDDMDMDDMAHSASIDQQFVQMMIPHHQGAITMADQYLKSGAQNEKLKALANTIKTDQQKEIQQMQAWLAGRKQ
ncbi:MAG TPA: DUF305 domain-containing protein [Flavisolibacter sp.]